MNKDKDVPILDHGYDGITEYDNPLPTWWLVTLFATIIFAFLYWIHYEFSGGQTNLQELEVDMAKIQVAQKKAPQGGESEEDLQKLLGVAPVLARGASVFQAKCAVCHGQELQGIMGPNLVDAYWINGKGSLSDIAKNIRVGIVDKGMPAWETQLPNEEITSLVAFIASKKGSNPANPKAPQGEKVEN